MKLIFSLIVITIVFTACSTKPNDFIGVHNFRKMEYYTVKDTTRFHQNNYISYYEEIKVYRLSPIKIDIFESGNELKGTMSLNLNTKKSLNTFQIKFDEKKVDLDNIHLVNDTLICDAKALFTTFQFKLSKNGGEYWLNISPSKNINKNAENCSKVAKVIGEQVSYRSVDINDKNTLQEIDESNVCSSKLTIENLISKRVYTTQDKDYLLKLLYEKPN